MMNERSIFVNSLTRLNVKLKHNKETFLHAIGPLSFDWDTSSSHVYDLSLPSRKDSKGGSSTANLVSTKTDIWNGKEGKLEEFITTFNYSSIVGVANKHGDARISVKMAIEYPDIYKNEINFFHHSIRVKITDKLTMMVPEFIEHPSKEPHTYILPPLSKNKIVTNRDAKVKLAYSIQTGTHFERGFDCVQSDDDVLLIQQEQQAQEFEENPILKIHKDGYIETLDKYGKATVIIEENQSLENQIVMLNIMISQIYSLSIEKPYTALNLPMGSETSLKITFQEENARSFADNIVGVDLFVENSHPHIVKATLDYYNSTLSLNALGIGEANIKVHTRDGIFDVINVKVLSSIIPHSPVQLHVGGTVKFVFSEKESHASTKWTTDDNSILKIDPIYGNAEGLKEGSAKAIYQGNVNLVSFVDVKKVDRIELDPKTKPEYFTNAKNNKNYQDETNIFLNVFLEDGLSEVYPEISFNGENLIKHNIKITCETEDTDFVLTYSRTIGNRFACVLKPVTNNMPSGNIPNTIRLNVRATSQYGVSYKTEEKFEIPFVSFFKIDHPQRNINFYSDERFKSIDIISNTDFTVDVEGNSDLVSWKKQEKRSNNHYEIQFSVPSSVNQDFRDLKVRISNAFTDSAETFFLSYYSKTKGHYSGGDEPSIPVKDPDSEKPIPNVPSTDSQIIPIIIIAIVICGMLLGLIFYCCSSVSTGYVDDSSFMSSDSRNRNRFDSTPKNRKGNSMRGSYSKFHHRNNLN